jgi:hypothetical protein
MYVTDKRFSFDNGRFRRDVIALVLCLSARVSYTYKSYKVVHRGFVLPHMYFSALLWTIRTIIYLNEDPYFKKYSVSDAEKALLLFMKIDKENQEKGGHGFIDMQKVPDGHPLENIWNDLIRLFVNTRPPYKFLLDYISIGQTENKPGLLKELFGAKNKSNSELKVTLLAEDFESNAKFLKNRIEKIAFNNDWSFTNNIMFTAHNMILLHNKSVPKSTVDAIVEKVSEWLPESNPKQIQDSYNQVITEYNKNSSKTRIRYVLGQIFQNMEKQNSDDIDERNTQLRLVLNDFISIAKSDSINYEKHLDFINYIKNYWGVL